MKAQLSFNSFLASKRELITKLNESLADSPVSLAEGKNQIFGYVCGYCDAMGWDHPQAIREFLDFCTQKNS